MPPILRIWFLYRFTGTFLKCLHLNGFKTQQKRGAILFLVLSISKKK